MAELRIYDEEDDKEIKITLAGPGVISVTFKDGTTQTMAWDLWRQLAMVIVGATNYA